MKAKVNLEVVGLCVVTKKAKEGHYTVVAVDPPDSGIPSHGAYLAFSRHALSKIEGTIPSFERVGEKSYSRIDASMFLMKLPPYTKVKVSPSSSEPQGRTLRTYDPARVSDLGLGCLKDGIGSGNWCSGEAARFDLPRNATKAGWGLRLGKYYFPATTEAKVVADLFFWKADYDKPCQIHLENDGEKLDGSVYLEGKAEVRIACYSEQDVLYPGETVAFDYCPALAPLCTGSEAQKPEPMEGGQQGCRRVFLGIFGKRESSQPADGASGRESRGKGIRHPRTGSCPPHEG